MKCSYFDIAVVDYIVIVSDAFMPNLWLFLMLFSTFEKLKVFHYEKVLFYKDNQHHIIAHHTFYAHT